MKTWGATEKASVRRSRRARCSIAIGRQDFARQHLADRFLKAGQAARLGDGAAGRVLHPEHVERHAVAGGEDFRIDNVHAEHRAGTGEAREEAGMILRVERQLRHVAVGLGLGGDGEGRVLRAFDQMRVADLRPGVEREPVAVGMAREIAVPGGFRPVAEMRGQGLLRLGDARLAVDRVIATLQHGLGFEIELAQQLRLPAVPDAGADGLDVDDGQDKEHFQPLGTLHQIGEVAHGARIGDVAALGDVGHHEMVLHQPGDRFRFAGTHAEARAETARDGGAGIRMILVAAFRDVVEEDRHVDRVAALDLAHQFMGFGIFLGIHPALDFRQDADGAQEMLVGRVVVIHVELHQRDDAAEIGDEAAEHAGLVHPAQRRFGVLARGEDFEKEAVCLLVLAQGAVDKLQRARQQLQRVGMNVETVLIGDMEKADDVDRVRVEEILLRDREAPVLDVEAANDFPATHRLHEAADGGLLLFLLILKHGAENARQVADILGDQGSSAS